VKPKKKRLSPKTAKPKKSVVRVRKKTQAKTNKKSPAQTKTAVSKIRTMKLNTNPLPVPGFFNPNRKNEIYIIDRAAIMKEALEAKKAHGILSTSQRPKICHAGIDWQIGFGPFPGATLPVGGSDNDAVRVAKMLYQYGHLIAQNNMTLDTHYTWQLFHPLFLVNAKDEAPTPGVPIPDSDIQNGTWTVNKEAANAWADNPSALPWLMGYLKHYSKELAASPRQYPFIPWPFHCQLGDVDHALFPLISEATRFWEIAGSHNFHPWLKGDRTSEAYSPLGEEVKKDHLGNAVGQLNTDFLNLLLANEAVICTGQAKSHCFRAFVADVLDFVRKQDPKLAQKIYLVEDGTSPVVIPGIVDFTDPANAAFDEFRNAGMNVVRTTTPLPEWPGMDRILKI
jgi:nicotinamidase-related amidase